VETLSIRKEDPIMKTTEQTIQKFPGTFRMILYIAVVAVLGLVSCMIKTDVPENNEDLTASLEAAVKVQSESEIMLEDWMLDPVHIESPDYLIVENEKEAKLEDWMLDPAECFVESLLTAQNSR
jgi:hypothetical protein